ncbi:iron ABC transporter substrate-binding protein [Aliarcobacter cryaerophilus ATCC 43158]|uniref:Iron siderophore ABC transporter, periplasmic substrate-binding protein n=1 Tax=Aliarcobacter cryaerophilus ATCC 43158 TaxID=1032070 RepID=A0AAD0XAH9_9BACT|nr:helical backbone metal receptor [Aliarcobacter cryaerophilus]AYJ80066.1 iron siderophore ABC transporter, periplasmic substrate-binding protein [Aliarcobacter cryaerophilus ATCC 43158]PRM97679.1 iron ABC transporter substrate-binding protein [Aliarcobacter cryaerophilus]QCZ24290.1 iron ABC transporter substrate-binding protein [Aliarcobacter cryaerophilus ATCC 43158]
MKKVLYFLLCLNILDANERIITLSPAINEIAFALGLGNKIIANTEFCDFPIESKNIQKVGGYGSVSLEKVVNLNPTIILNQDYDKKLNQSLKDLNFKTLVYKTNSLEDIKFTIKDLGEVFNKKEEAKNLNNQIENSLESLKNIIENKKILIVISPQNTLSNQIFVAGNFIYFEDIIKSSNNVNAYQSSLKSQPSINSEKLITLNPDIIILLAPFLENDEKSKEKYIKMWEKLPINASKKKNVYIIDKLYSGIPSHRIKYFIDDFKGILEDVRTKKLQ